MWLSRRSPRDSEGNRMIAVVAMHEDQPDRPLAAAKFVLDAAAHSEVSIEALGRIDVTLAHDAMAESAGAGLEPPMHRAAGMERLAELSQRSVKNLDRIAVGVAQLEDFEHSTLLELRPRSQRETLSPLLTADVASARIRRRPLRGNPGMRGRRCRRHAEPADDAGSPFAGSIDRTRLH